MPVQPITGDAILKYKVIIVDDSQFFREMLSSIINGLDDYEVVATAEDPYDAREKIKQHEPDLVTIDINMPKMDGVTFLRNLMRLHPMPSIIITTDPSRHKEVYEDGALAYVQKVGIGESPHEFIQRVQETILSFEYLYAHYAEKKPQATQQTSDDMKLHPDVLLPKQPGLYTKGRVIAIGASTGGIETLSQMFAQLKPPLPPIVIAQHIPYGFSKSFAARLNRITPLQVIEAAEELPLEADRVYIAQGNRHLIVQKSQNSPQLNVCPLDGVKISRHRPSIDLLFRSVNNCFGNQAMAVLLTGMGDDGVIGIGEIHESGGLTIAQNEASSIIFGMAKKAIDAGYIQKILTPDQIVEHMASFKNPKRK